MTAVTTLPPGPRIAFFKEIARLWSPSRPSPTLTRLEYLRSLAKYAAHLESEPTPTEADLELFRRIVMQRPDDLRHRLLGANVYLLRNLSERQRAGLQALEVTPDLLSPSGELRYEPSHSRLMAYLMDHRKSRLHPNTLLRAFLELAEAPSETLELDNLAVAQVSAEAVISTGRVDVVIDTPRLLVFVEAKIDASESPAQLSRYRQALDARAGPRAACLVFITMPDALGPPSTLTCAHITMVDLLEAWLPFARAGGDAAGFLARYLKSLALLLSRVGNGVFEDWTFTQQRSALALLANIDP